MHRRSDRLGVIRCKLKQVSTSAPVTGGPNIGVLTADVAYPIRRGHRCRSTPTAHDVCVSQSSVLKRIAGTRDRQHAAHYGASHFLGEPNGGDGSNQAGQLISRQLQGIGARRRRSAKVFSAQREKAPSRSNSAAAAASSTMSSRWDTASLRFRIV
jgi:hypothetical protein